MGRKRSLASLRLPDIRTQADNRTTAQVRRFEVDDLCVVKLSIPRPSPQGGVVECDTHCG